MPTGNFRLPADYYSAPLSEVRPIFPRWVPYGCGSASAAFLVLLFASSALLSGARVGGMMDMVVGMSLGEVRGMFTPEVTAEQKAAFDREVEAMRGGLRSNKVPLAKVQPFLQAMQKAISDRKVTPQEVDSLTGTARSAASGR
jgi:hypothetical protein